MRDQKKRRFGEQIEKEDFIVACALAIGIFWSLVLAFLLGSI